MSEITLTFPDGAERSAPPGSPARSLAEAISKSLAKKAVAMAVDGRLADLADPIPGDAAVKILTRTDPEALELIRHDAAHVMAEAVQELWPGTQVTIGPRHRERLLLRLRQGRAVPPGRPAAHRGEDARDHPPQRAVHERGVEPRARQGGVRRDGRDLQGRARRRHPARRGRQDLQTGRVVRPLPRAAHDLDRPGRLCLQIAEDRRRLLARRLDQAHAAAPLRHRLGDRSRGSPPT